MADIFWSLPVTASTKPGDIMVDPIGGKWIVKVTMTEPNGTVHVMDLQPVPSDAHLDIYVVPDLA